MEAVFKTVLKDPEDGIYEYKLLGWNDICCSTLEEAIDADFIGFGEFRDDTLNYSSDVTISHCSSYPEGVVFDYLTIHFCPFCGKPIRAVEKQRVRLVTERKYVTKEIETTHEEPV